MLLLNKHMPTWTSSKKVKFCFGLQMNLLKK